MGKRHDFSALQPSALLCREGDNNVRHQDLRLNPQHPNKKLSTVACT